MDKERKVSRGDEGIDEGERKGGRVERREGWRRVVRKVQVEVRYGLLNVYRSVVRANYRLYF